MGFPCETLPFCLGSGNDNGADGHLLRRGPEAVREGELVQIGPTA